MKIRPMHRSCWPYLGSLKLAYLKKDNKYLLKIFLADISEVAKMNVYFVKQMPMFASHEL